MKILATIVVAVMLSGCQTLFKAEPVFIREPVAIEAPVPQLPPRPVLATIPEADKESHQVVLRLTQIALEQITAYSTQLENLLETYKNQNVKKNEEVKRMVEEAKKKQGLK